MTTDSFQFTLPDSDIEFSLRRLVYRDYKKAIAIIEQIRESGVSVKTMTLIDKGIALCVVGWNRPEPITELENVIAFDQAMELIGATVRGARLNNEERKKSELPHSSGAANCVNPADAIAATS